MADQKSVVTVCSLIVEGVTREVFELFGDRVPPVAIQPVQRKKAPKWPHRILPWYDATATLGGDYASY